MVHSSTGGSSIGCTVAPRNMDFFDLLPSSPPPKKKQKIGEPGVHPQLVSSPPKQKVAHSTDVKNEVVESEHEPELKKHDRGRPCKRRGYRRQEIQLQTVKQRLKKWGLDKEFTVCGGSRLGCMACMKYAAWCEQEGADTKKKKRKKQKKKRKKPPPTREEHTEEVKSPEKPHGPAEADRDDEESKHADIQHALQKGTYQPPEGRSENKLRYCLLRHVSGARHKTATGAREREVEENKSVDKKDVPSDAQMRFVYDEVKKHPMVPSLPGGYQGL